MAQTEQAAVRQAAEDFYAALNAMFEGDLAPMQQVWSHADDVTYMGPVGGIRIGWAEVLRDWEAQAAMKLGGRVEGKSLAITLGHDLAAVHHRASGHNVPRGERREIDVRATALFRKEDGAWKMVGLHSDLLPYLKP